MSITVFQFRLCRFQAALSQSWYALIFLWIGMNRHGCDIICHLTTGEGFSFIISILFSITIINISKLTFPDALLMFFSIDSKLVLTTRANRSLLFNLFNSFTLLS